MWFHGDIASGNLLVVDGKLTAVIEQVIGEVLADDDHFARPRRDLLDQRRGSTPATAPGTAPENPVPRACRFITLAISRAATAHTAARHRDE